MSVFEQAFRNIDDVLRKEAGCTTELDYTEQSSWLLFLKYLDGLEGFGGDQLAEMQKIIDAEKSDLFDVLAHVAYALPTVTREARAAKASVAISTQFSSKQQAFLDFVLSHYVRVGVEELDQEKLTPCCGSSITTPSPTPSPTWVGRMRSGGLSRASRNICIRNRRHNGPLQKG